MSAPELPFHYLAVDGPIGVGKTTLVEKLCERLEGVKLLEDVSNPFLADFYKDRPGTAFQTQLYFLLSRYKQQQEVHQRGLFERLVLADYTFDKDRIFAYLNLSDDELSLYDKLYKLLERPEVAEDVVSRALEVAESVAQAAPIATRLTKAGLAQGSRGGFEVALQWEALAQPVTMATADIRKGIQARREHRPPTFDGS